MMISKARAMAALPVFLPTAWPAIAAAQVLVIPPPPPEPVPPPIVVPAPLPEPPPAEPHRDGVSGAGDATSATPATNTLDPGIRKMIETAIETSNEATVQSVLKVARQAAPEAKDEIDRHEKDWRARLARRNVEAAEERVAKLRAAGPLEYWKGEAELGASRVTGSSTNFGLLAALDIKREGIDWSHQLSARAEIQETNGVTTAERLFAAWQPKYRVEKSNTYAFGLAQYEQDRFAGYEGRYTVGGGVGYRAVNTPRVKLDLDGGPTLRRVEQVDGNTMTRFAARGSLNFSWRVSPSLSFTQKAAAYLEGSDGNLVTSTALDTKLIGNLKARFSYNVQYERNPAFGGAEWNTQSRASFVYGF